MNRGDGAPEGAGSSYVVRRVVRTYSPSSTPSGVFLTIRAALFVRHEGLLRHASSVSRAPGRRAYSRRAVPRTAPVPVCETETEAPPRSTPGLSGFGSRFRVRSTSRTPHDASPVSGSARRIREVEGAGIRGRKRLKNQWGCSHNPHPEEPAAHPSRRALRALLRMRQREARRRASRRMKATALSNLCHARNV